MQAQGYLHKEMRICAVVGYSSSTYQLQKWRKGFCTSHNCHRTSQDCTCPDLFQLYPFPTLNVLHVEIVLKTKQPEAETSLVYDVFIRVIRKESAS